jgi:hypothetical protein
MLDYLVFLRRQLINIFVGRLTGLDRVLDAIPACH